MSRYISATYWTFTIIAVCTTGILGYVGGYSVGSRQSDTTSITEYVEQPDIEADIFNQAITAETQVEGSTTDGTSSAEEIHAFTGYVRNISSNTVTLDNPDKTVTGVHELDFSLETSTRFFETREVLADGKLEYQTLELSLTDIAVDDIVTVYTQEDIRGADVRFVTAMERLVKQ